jgi:hypothetical protein
MCIHASEQKYKAIPTFYDVLREVPERSDPFSILSRFVIVYYLKI